MPTATVAAVKQQIASAQPAPIYVLYGEDEIEKGALAHAFGDLVEDGLRAFNLERIHAGEATSGDRLASTVANLVAAARTLPMMAPRRVVVVLQAEALLMPKRESEAADRAIEQLRGLLEQPEPQTTLVLVARALDKRGKLFKALLKEATFVDCGVLESLGDAERWVKNRVAAAGAVIEPAAARLMSERCGTDLKRLRNDVDRLLLYALGQKAITADDVRELVGPAALQDDWAMTNAIEAGNGAAALRQLALLLEAGAPPEKVLGQLGWVVRAKFPQAAPAQLAGAIDAVFRTDLDLKRTANDPRALLERLVVELCGRKRSVIRAR